MAPTEFVARYLTFEEYLNYEQESQTRNELVGGQVYPMAGASRAHN